MDRIIGVEAAQQHEIATVHGAGISIDQPWQRDLVRRFAQQCEIIIHHADSGGKQ